MNTTSELKYKGRDSRFRPRQVSQLLRISVLAATGLAVLLLSILIGSAVGPVSIPLKETFAAMLHATGWLEHIQIAERNLTIILDIRLPRVIVGALVGAGLSIAGAAMQGVFRNPLVEPGYLGVSSGAAAGAVLCIALGLVRHSAFALPLSAFAGALISVVLILAIWRASGKPNVTTLLLLGIGMNALLSAVINVIIASAPHEQQLRSIVFWLQGGLEARTWEHVHIIALPILIGGVLLALFSRSLNLLLLGDEHAQSSGVHVQITRYTILLLASFLTGTAVSVSGIIGFVGLVIPHLVRLIVGSDHRLLLPFSALFGASFLVLADLASRMVLQPITLQVGVVCACIGAPLFMMMLLRKRKEGST
ncbi:FecCD family ABC transporter permease [Paenibacillus alvei]|uniref:FecCD family ABC transporter permease n=1 Tax=Paenibacillus alvei TaxID=44250 RepID=UPI002282CBF5|nr:iron ABC transporter permease [Paenibacillus alvei]